MTPVQFHFVLPTGAPMANATVDIQLGRASHTGSLTGITMPRPISINTDADGKAVLNLWPSSTAYFVQVLDTSSDAGIFYKFLVPEVPVGQVVRLQDIVIDAPMSGVFYDDAALLVIHAAKASALASSISAAESAAQIAQAVIDVQAAVGAADAAALSEFNAGVKAAEALASAQAAASSAVAASGSAGQANQSKADADTSASAASQSAANAAGSAGQATTRAGEALGYKNQAEAFATNAYNSAVAADASADAAAQSAASAAAVSVGDVVLSFNNRRGDVSLTVADMQAALGYVPVEPAHTHPYLPLTGGNVTGSVGIDGTLTAGTITSTGRVTASSDGFASATYAFNQRNPIWRFGNSDGYGLSYFQGTAGYGGADSIGVHFGTPTTAGSQFVFRGGGDLLVSGQVYAGGNQVWHAGNFNPSLYAPLTSPNFSGTPSVGGSTIWHSGNINPFRFETFTADANTLPGNRSAFTYANNAPHTGPLVHFDAADYGLQLNAAYSIGGTSLAFRTRNGDSGGFWNSWHQVWHSGVVGSPADKTSGAMQSFASSIETYGSVYNRGDLYVLNGAGNGWYTLVSRNGGSPIVTATRFDLGNGGGATLQHGSNLSMRVSTPYGYADFGPQNPDFCHIYTDRPTFAFNKPLNLLGNQLEAGYGVFTGGVTTSGVAFPAGANLADTINGAPWHGVSRTSSDIYGSGGQQIHIAGYYGVRIRSSSAVLEIYPGSMGANCPFSVTRLIAGDDSGQPGSVNANNWFRSFGDTGWYSETHGGGIYQRESNWVETYGGRAFRVISPTAGHGMLHLIGQGAGAQEVSMNFRDGNESVDQGWTVGRYSDRLFWYTNGAQRMQLMRADGELRVQGRLLVGGDVQTGTGTEVGYRKVPLITTTGGTAGSDVAGRGYKTTGSISIAGGVFGEGDVFTIYNNSGSAISLVQGASMTLRKAGSATTGNLTIAARGLVTVMMVSTNEAVATGAGLS